VGFYGQQQHMGIYVPDEQNRWKIPYPLKSHSTNNGFIVWPRHGLEKKVNKQWENNSNREEALFVRKGHFKEHIHKVRACIPQ
jgi:hypothetical protein